MRAKLLFSKEVFFSSRNCFFEREKEVNIALVKAQYGSFPAVRRGSIPHNLGFNYFSFALITRSCKDNIYNILKPFGFRILYIYNTKVLLTKILIQNTFLFWLLFSFAFLAIPANPLRKPAITGASGGLPKKPLRAGQTLNPRILFGIKILDGP